MIKIVNKYILILFCFCCLPFLGITQKLIKIIHADTITQYDRLPGNTILKGNVIFEHDGARLYCDSAYLKEKESLLKAYSKVQINQGDTVNLYGDSLYFYGKTKYAKVRGNVRFRDREYKLVTDSLDFDMKKSFAFYKNGGTITHVKQNQTIVSRVGYYYGDSRSLYFRDSVKIKAPKYKVFSDTLQYNIKQGKTFFYGPTTIYTDSMKIYCEDGYFNTESEKGTFKKNAYFVSKSQRISGDSLFFDQKTQIGIGKGNVALLDTAEKIQFTGQYAFLDDNAGKSLVCGDAIARQFDGIDTLYIRADTLRRFRDTTLRQESMWAYFDVRIFSKDMSGLCDSASYSDSDSLLHLYKDPILWSEDAQITGNSMRLKTKNNELDRIWVRQNAMTIRPADSVYNKYFNQVSGKYMTAYFDSSKLNKIFVRQNAQTIYFTVDSLKYSGMNESKSSEIHMYMKGNDIERVVMHKDPEGTYYPFDQIPPNADRLEGFQWRLKEKPKHLKDLYKDSNNYFVAPPAHQFENIQQKNHWMRFHQIIEREFTTKDSAAVTFTFLSDTIAIDSSWKAQNFKFYSPDSTQAIAFQPHADSLKDTTSGFVFYDLQDSLIYQCNGIDTAQIQNVIWIKPYHIQVMGEEKGEEKKYFPTLWNFDFKNHVFQVQKTEAPLEKKKRQYKIRSLK